MFSRLSTMSTGGILAMVMLIFAVGIGGSLYQIRLVTLQIGSLDALPEGQPIHGIAQTHIDFLKARHALHMASTGEATDWRMRYEIAASRVAFLDAFVAHWDRATPEELEPVRRYARFIADADEALATISDEKRLLARLTQLAQEAEPLFGTLSHLGLRRTLQAREEVHLNHDATLRTMRVVSIGAMAAMLAFLLALLRIYHELRLRTDGLERLSVQLRHALKVRQRFLASVSHDFRTPLNAIAGFAQIMLHKDIHTSEAKRQRFLDQILDASRRLERMTCDLLDLARLEQGAFALKPEDDVCLPDLVRSVVAQFGLAAASKGVTVLGPSKGDDAAIGPALARRRIDPDAMERAVANLLENAVKFSPPGGIVTASVRAEGGSLRIMVEDQGPGIAPDRLDDIWDLFGRRAEGPGGALQGTGMGLAIARGLAEAHGGRLTVRSRPGDGSRFSIHLPATAAPASTPSPPPARPLAESA
ncbi:MAG: signal transduction histidine kinase [Paracoccaceae bacterium]|jgi:signal transduction histidine kinase